MDPLAIARAKTGGGLGPARRWDGAIGTELIARGLDLSREAPEAWTLRRPEVLAALHAAYIEAGAEVLQTNTFGASRPRLCATGLEGALAAVNREAVALARAARPTWLVASLGPTGIDVFGAESARAIEDAYAEQIEHLVAAGVDALHFETMYHPVEVRAGLAAARRIAPGHPAYVSITCSLGDQGYQTPLGVSLAAMASAVIDEEPDAIGLNCSLEARKMLGPVRLLRDLTERPLIVRPQAGAPSAGCKGDPRGDDPARFAHDARSLVSAGADAIGGCCGVGPAHIAALTESLAALGAIP